MMASAPGDDYVFGNLLWNFDGKLNCMAWQKDKGAWSYICGWERQDDGRILLGHAHPRMNLLALENRCICVCLFLSALNCTNVSRTQHSPSERLQKARARRGKKPLFSFWTLEVAIPRDTTDEGDGSGTHSSPRVHLRRGHIKHRKTGYFWWQPHAVGNKKHGMVMKDYAANYKTRQAFNPASPPPPPCRFDNKQATS